MAKQQRHDDILESSNDAGMAFGIRRPKVAVLVGAVLVIWGLVSTIVVPKESSPYIEFGIVNISTVYTGASAIDVDSLITQEIESKIDGISGLNKYSSVSRNSTSSIQLEFLPGQDMTKAMSDVRSRVDEAKPSLPAEIESDPAIREIDRAARSNHLFHWCSRATGRQMKCSTLPKN